MPPEQQSLKLLPTTEPYNAFPKRRFSLFWLGCGLRLLLTVSFIGVGVVGLPAEIKGIL